MSASQQIEGLIAVISAVELRGPEPMLSAVLAVLGTHLQIVLGEVRCLEASAAAADAVVIRFPGERR